MGGRFKREGIYVYLWLIPVEVWQKTTKFCKAITFQLKNKKYIYFIYLTASGLRCGAGTLNCTTWMPCCGMWDLVPWPGIEPGPPVLGAQSLNHGTIREVPRVSFFPCVKKRVSQETGAEQGAWEGHRSHRPGEGWQRLDVEGLGLDMLWRCMCAESASDSATPWTVACQAPLSMGFSR